MPRQLTPILTFSLFVLSHVHVTFGVLNVTRSFLFARATSRCPSVCYTTQDEAERDCSAKLQRCEVRMPCTLSGDTMSRRGYTCTECECTIMTKGTSFGFDISESCSASGVFRGVKENAQYYVTAGVSRECITSCIEREVRGGAWCAGSASLFGQCCEDECGGTSGDGCVCFRGIRSGGGQGTNCEKGVLEQEFGMRASCGCGDGRSPREMLLWVADGADEGCLARCLKEGLEGEVCDGTAIVGDQGLTAVERSLMQLSARCCGACGGKYEDGFNGCGVTMLE